MTNFDYYIKGNKMEEGWKVFVKTAYNKNGRALDKYNKWLLEEHEEPILDDVEREYLSSVIKPFRNRVEFILKEKVCGDEFYYIGIFVDGEYTFLPYFKKSTKMYAGMKLDKRYTLKELNL